MHMHYDLLTNPINCGWAINCEVTPEDVTIGGFYLEPDMPGTELPLESGSVKLTLLLPEELVRQPEPFRAWNIKLPIKTKEG